jgi:hypothetical protein
MNIFNFFNDRIGLDGRNFQIGALGTLGKYGLTGKIFLASTFRTFMSMNVNDDQKPCLTLPQRHQREDRI